MLKENVPAAGEDWMERSCPLDPDTRAEECQTALNQACSTMDL